MSSKSFLAVLVLGRLESLLGGRGGLVSSGGSFSHTLNCPCCRSRRMKALALEPKFPVLLKCEKCVNSSLSSWGVMFSNEDENHAVLHLPLNIFRGCDVMESVVSVSASALPPPTPNLFLGSLSFFVILPWISWPLSQSFFVPRY